MEHVVHVEAVVHIFGVAWVRHRVARSVLASLARVSVRQSLRADVPAGGAAPESGAEERPRREGGCAARLEAVAPDGERKGVPTGQRQRGDVAAVGTPTKRRKRGGKRKFLDGQRAGGRGGIIFSKTSKDKIATPKIAMAPNALHRIR